MNIPLSETVIRLEILISHAKALNPNDFDYTDLVQEITNEQTQERHLKCCFAGWMPLWFPESGFSYESPNGFVRLAYKGEFHREAIVTGLSEFFGISPKIVGVLFFGELLIANYNTHRQVHIKSCYGVSLGELIDRFSFVASALKYGWIHQDFSTNLRA